MATKFPLITTLAMALTSHSLRKARHMIHPHLGVAEQVQEVTQKLHARMTQTPIGVKQAALEGGQQHAQMAAAVARHQNLMVCTYKREERSKKGEANIRKKQSRHDKKKQMYFLEYSLQNSATIATPEK